MKDKIFERAHLFYAVAVPLCLAFVLTVAMFIKMRAWEQERTTLTFERQTATLGRRSRRVSTAILKFCTPSAVSKPARDKGIRLQQVIVPNLQEACIDEQRIVQVLTNLLGNAVKFTPEGGDVVVRVEDDPERTAYLLVAVSDTGRGIAPEQCGHIFDRLYQVREDDTAIEGGLGLGLHICQEVVRLHSGEIWVDSTLGQGSTFFFTLPKHIV